MPGISLLHDSSPSSHVRSVGKSALDTVCFRNGYDARTISADRRTFVGSSGYPEYPVLSVETSDAYFVLEGQLYDVDDAKHHLEMIGSALLDERLRDVRAWLESRDGEFVVLAHEKRTGTTRLVNDTFARLPIYCATAGETTILSREMKFIRNVAQYHDDPLDLDSMAVAQSLLFGYRLGDRTLFEGVERVPPGSFVRVGDEVHVERLHQHDFEGSAHADRSVSENATALASLFEDACANRNLDGLPNVLSLSGGLDSRAVGGGYDAAGAPFVAATFEKPNGANATDVEIAERIADSLNVEWERYRVEETEAHQADLLEMKQGLNFLGMSFILDFFEQLRARHGSAVYVTGDGGDKVLPDLTPPRSFSSRRELAEYIIDVHSVFDFAEAAAIAGVDSEALVRSVERRLASYPESTREASYVHFLVRERGINWLNQGEDRNRYYFWSTTPFYSKPFFEYAMNVPASQKRHGELFAAFLDELHPALGDIENANYGATITSFEHKTKQFAERLITRYPTVKNAIASLLNGSADDGLYHVVSERLRQADETSIEQERLESVLHDVGSYGGRELYNLLTVVAVDDWRPDKIRVTSAPGTPFVDQ